MIDNCNHPKRRYYRVESGPCYDVLSRWKEQRDAITQQHFEFSKSVGGVGYIPGNDDHVGNAVAIHGIAFADDLPKGWRARSLSMTPDLGDAKTIAIPDKRTSIGRKVTADIEALPLRPSTYGPCDEIGFPSSLQYSGNDVQRGTTHMDVWETMIVGWLTAGEQVAFYVALPDEHHHRERLKAKGYTVEGEPWSPLPGMVEILKEEMDLDFAKAKVAGAKGGAA